MGGEHMPANSKRRACDSRRVQGRPKPSSLNRTRKVIYRVEGINNRRQQLQFYVKEYGLWDELQPSELAILSERPTAYWPRERVDQANQLIRTVFRRLLDRHIRELLDRAGPELADWRRSKGYDHCRRVLWRSPGTKITWDDLRRVQRQLIRMDQLVSDF